jgi:cell division protein FtsI/penicillin-binding protein 2
MKQAILEGIVKGGQLETVSSSSKTSTVETIILENNIRINKSWLTSFFPFEKPRYCVIILSEEDKGGTKNSGPVFKEFVQEITFKIMSAHHNN